MGSGQSSSRFQSLVKIKRSKSSESFSQSWFSPEGWLDPQRDLQFLPRKKNGEIMVEEEVDFSDETDLNLSSTSDLAPIHPPEEPIEKDNRNFDDILRDLKIGEYFSDDDFPPDNNALFYSDKCDPEIKWISPKELSTFPRLLVEGVSKDDIMQGILGDCWFLSSCAAIAQHPHLMRKVIPTGQALCGKKYKGIVKFRFWRFGEWCEVYVDDKLPIKKDKLIYAKNSDSSEFWVSLLEKAYAKLHGSFEAIEGGQAMDALVDLTGGLAERYELKEHTKELYQKISRAASSGAFITCSRKGDWRSVSNEPDEYGLIAGHAYTITSVKRIRRKHGFECLLRIRNPWGMGEEWTGAWSDLDDRWKLVDEETKEWMQFVQREDGEFWMSYKDFVQHFQEVTMCTVGPDLDGDGIPDEANNFLCLHGKWISGLSAGGCRNDIQAFSTNPQFLLIVHEPDQKDGSWLTNEDAPTTCSVLIGLMQEHRRSQRHIGVKMLQIAFLIYKVDKAVSRIPPEHFMYNYETAKSGVYVNYREVCGRFEFSPGHYIIVPSTYEKDSEGSFLLRVYAAQPISLQELKGLGSEQVKGVVEEDSGCEDKEGTSSDDRDYISDSDY